DIGHELHGEMTILMTYFELSLEFLKFGLPEREPKRARFKMVRPVLVASDRTPHSILEDEPLGIGLDIECHRNQLFRRATGQTAAETEPRRSEEDRSAKRVQYVGPPQLMVEPRLAEPCESRLLTSFFHWLRASRRQ